MYMTDLLARDHSYGGNLTFGMQNNWPLAGETGLPLKSGALYSVYRRSQHTPAAYTGRPAMRVDRK
ncbi:hypothetical protein DPMN_178297 [Dreissena polymorpha]|uniref:Uncharacterized protein n=1 Tax=Dreissena polymorpha TaxID=45954 RepID=A0A9D4ECL8_DREPO|nr:hypothetical protein DPMN_178297 [Dreissena polymorpha]